MKTLMPLPFQVALIIGVAAMALAVFQVCHREVGTIRLDGGWARACAKRLSETLRAMFRRVQLPRWRSLLWSDAALAAALVAVLAIGLTMPEQADGAQFANGAPTVLAAPILNRLKSLKQERANLATESERVLATAAAEDRDLTDEEKKGDDERHARIEALNHEIGRIERLKAKERAVILPEEEKAVALAGGDPRCGFRSLGEFARAVHRACDPGARVVDPRLGNMLAAPTGYIQESGGAAGEGYQVPPAFRQQIFELVFNDEGILAEIDLEPTDSNAVEMDADETTPWGSSGVQAKWRNETVQMTGTKPDTDHRITRLHDLYAFVIGTDNLLQDAPRLEARLTRKASQAILWKVAEAVFNGTGAGQPLGWMKSPALVTVTKEAAQAATTIVAKNVLKMYARLLDTAGMAKWYANRDIVPELATMTIGDQPIWTPPVAGLQQAPGGFLLGLPIKWSEHAETLGTKGDLQLVAPKGYYGISKAAGIQFASSIHLYFDYGMEAFRWTFRIGGQPYLSAAVDPAKGTNKKSHFVALETRS